MIAGEVVQLPRLERYCCDGCRRIVPIGFVVTLDLPAGGWVIACGRCYDAVGVGLWRGFPVVWNGERWLQKAESGEDGGSGGEAPPPRVGSGF
jgi:hypothetical protein